MNGSQNQNYDEKDCILRFVTADTVVPGEGKESDPIFSLKQSDLAVHS